MKDVKVVRWGLKNKYTSHTINHEKLHCEVGISSKDKKLERMTCKVTRCDNTTNYYFITVKVNDIDIDIRINHI